MRTYRPETDPAAEGLLRVLNQASTKEILVGMKRKPLRRIAIVLLAVTGLISLAVWSVLPASIPARGRFHDFVLDTTVDSEAAKYYIESYAQGSVDDPQLH